MSVLKSYVVKKKNKNKKISKFKIKTEGYEFKPNIRKNCLIKIDSLTVYNLEMIERLLEKKIEISFRKLTKLVFDEVNDEEGNQGGICIALNELTKMKSMIINEFKAFIKKSDYDKYMKRLKLFEKELKNKLIFLEEKVKLKEEEEVKHR